MKISSLMVSIIIVGMLMIGFSAYITESNNNYNTVVNESELDTFNKVYEITNLTENTKQRVDDISDNPNFLDKLSSFFNAGIIALKTTFKSFDLMSSIINEGTDKTDLDRYTSSLQAILLVIVFIAIAIAAIIKWRT